MADIFVEMEKDGMRLVVHPTTVDAHKRAGWKVVKEGVALPPKASGKDKDAEPPKDKEPDKGKSEADKGAAEPSGK